MTGNRTAPSASAEHQSRRTHCHLGCSYETLGIPPFSVLAAPLSRYLGCCLLLTLCLGQSCDLGSLLDPGGFSGGDVIGYHPDQPPNGDPPDSPINPAGGSDGTSLVVEAGVPLTVLGGQAVALQGTASGGATGATLSYQWTQTAGLRVLLTGTSTLIAGFTAPTVLADSLLTFQLTVSDGTLTATDTVDVTVVRAFSPQLAIIPTPTQGPAPLQVSFTVQSATISPLPGGTYTWDFNDQTAVAQGTSVIHVFQKPGTYAVKLCLTLPPPQTQEPACTETLISVTAPTSGLRQPQWPLKTSRSLYTDAQIAQLRQLVTTDRVILGMRQAAESHAAKWIGYTNEQLRELLPDSRVCRAVDVSTKGCPVHGTAVYQHGTYPWELDPNNRFKVICPVGGESYPSNDFEAYYRGDMKDSSLLTGKYVDSGRGYVAPDGEKYWFVAYACHWNWYKNWEYAIPWLAQAYVLTGDRIYAEKAIVMLDRIAEIYPGMDYDKQSRYGEMVDYPYPGKIFNAIWETRPLRELAVAYELAFDALTGSNPISLPWRSTTEIRANIEANLLEEGIDAVARGQVAGNFGSHQNTLIHAVVVRQQGPIQRLLDGIFTTTGGPIRSEGLDYALYNLLYKDGMPCETSPYYCSTWVNNITEMSLPLLRADVNLFENSKVQRMLDAQLDMICASRFTPAIGDAGSIQDGLIGPTTPTYLAGYQEMGRPEYAWVLDQIGELRGGWTYYFTDCLRGPIDLDIFNAGLASYRHEPKSRLLDGYGLSVLNNSPDRTAVSLFYGISLWAGHYDRLNIELFGQDRRLSPDLGYPDAANPYVSGIFSWTQNTVSHNTLLVDDGKQDGNIAGKVLRFHESPTVHVVDVDAAGTYAAADVYRRTLVLVVVDEENSYLVDVFRVRGGNKHVLSIHGPEGPFALSGTPLSSPVTQGTLAGTNVAYGHLYDDPVLGASGYTGPFSRYRGSGYSHLFNWQHAAPTAPITAQWRTTDNLAGLRVHVPAHSQQDVIVADAYVSPLRRTPTILKYMLVRRSADMSGNTFVSVWEPNGSQSFIESVSLSNDASLGQASDQIVVLSVQRPGAIDTIVVSPQSGSGFTLPSGLSSDASVAVVTLADGQLSRGFAAGGTGLSMSQPPLEIAVPATVTGSITAAAYASKTITVACDQPAQNVPALVGRMVRLFNTSHSCMYQIASAQVAGGGLVLGLDGSEVFTGRVSVRSASATARTVTTPTKVPHPANLAGMRLLTDDLSAQAMIVSMSNAGTIQLASDTDMTPFAAGTPYNAWVADFGPGDSVEIEMSVHMP